jgi:acetate kinase
LMRMWICRDLDWFGIALDDVRNKEAKGEVPIHAATSRVQLWIMPTNEELIVARQAKELLQSVSPRPEGGR